MKIFISTLKYKQKSASKQGGVKTAASKQGSVKTAASKQAASETTTLSLPFYHPDGRIYQQIDGVAMGSPLGPLFADFYLGDIEAKVIPNVSNSVLMYARYVDDILVVYNKGPGAHDCVGDLQHRLETNSVLKFTCELPNAAGSIPFLDVLLTTIEGEIHFEPYCKPCDSGECLRGDGYCTEGQKRAVVMGQLHRAYKRSENPTQFAAQMSRIRSILINNGYTNRMLDAVMRSFTPRPKEPPHLIEPSCDVDLFYCNQMHDNYLVDERKLRDIIRHPH